MTNVQSKPAIAQVGKFLAALVGTTALCLTAYTVAVDRLVDDSALPSTYKWFLLKNVPGPRIIFESGSNSHHAIDTDILGKALGITAINIADNGGYALEDKLTRLETYTRPGDIVVLPLEWTFYHREKLTDNYVNSLFGNNHDYYRSMPTSKRVKRALSLPPETVIGEFFKDKSASTKETESPAKDLFLSALTQPSGHQSNQFSSGAGEGVSGQSCDEYVFGNSAKRQSLKVGNNLRPALKRLQNLKSRGVDVHFSWPVLSGEACMTDPLSIQSFRDNIEATIKQAGFEFLGTPRQSLYPQKLQDDTPYHLIEEGTKIHTSKMINFLKGHGYGTSGKPLDIKTFARDKIFELELAEISSLKQAALPLNKPIAMDDEDRRNYVDFTAGWWAFEPYGRWMRDNNATFRVTLPKTLSENSVLRVNGITKSGRPERVKVMSNGVQITSGLFGGNIPLVLPTAGLSRGEALSIFVELTDAGVPQSPLDLGESEDTRSMTLHFQTIELTDTAVVALPVVAPLASMLAPADAIPSFIPPTVNAEPIKVLPTKTNYSRYLPAPSFSNFGSTNLLGSCLPVTGNAPQRLSSIEYGQGWWAQESQGRWMKGKEAVIALKLPSASQRTGPINYTLNLVGDFFLGKPMPVEVLVDGEEAGSVQYTADGRIIAAFVKPLTATDVKVTVKLAGPESLSPRQLGLSPDDRTLTYFLKSIEVAPT